MVNPKKAPKKEPKAIAKAIPKEKAKEKVKEDNLHDNCAICMDKIVTNTNILILRCNHSFHYKCIGEWLTSSDSCPVCRKSTEETEISSIKFIDNTIENINRKIQEEFITKSPKKRIIKPCPICNKKFTNRTLEIKLNAKKQHMRDAHKENYNAYYLFEENDKVSDILSVKLSIDYTNCKGDLKRIQRSIGYVYEEDTGGDDDEINSDYFDVYSEDEY